MKARLSTAPWDQQRLLLSCAAQARAGRPGSPTLVMSAHCPRVLRPTCRHMQCNQRTRQQIKPQHPELAERQLHCTGKVWMVTVSNWMTGSCQHLHSPPLHSPKFMPKLTPRDAAAPHRQACAPGIFAHLEAVLLLLLLMVLLGGCRTGCHDSSMLSLPTCKHATAARRCLIALAVHQLLYHRIQHTPC